MASCAEGRQRRKVGVESLLAFSQAVVDATDIQLSFGGAPAVVGRLEEGERLTPVFERAPFFAESSIRHGDVREDGRGRRPVAGRLDELPGLKMRIQCLLSIAQLVLEIAESREREGLAPRLLHLPPQRERSMIRVESLLGLTEHLIDVPDRHQGLRLSPGVIQRAPL